MKRRVIKLLTVLSLLLCVLAIGLWIRSARRWDKLVFRIGSTHSLSVRSADGGAELRLRSGGEPEVVLAEIGWKPESPPLPGDSASGYADILTFPADEIFTDDLFWQDTHFAQRFGFKFRRAEFMHSQCPKIPRW